MHGSEGGEALGLPDPYQLILFSCVLYGGEDAQLRACFFSLRYRVRSLMCNACATLRRLLLCSCNSWLMCCASTSCSEEAVSGFGAAGWAAASSARAGEEAMLLCKCISKTS